MDVQTIQKVLKSEPFRPFAIRLTDGTRFEIAHPELVVVSNRDVMLMHLKEGKTIHVEPLLIATLEIAMAPDEGKAAESHPEHN